jgi:carboxyl-terminal processing protease
MNRISRNRLLFLLLSLALVAPVLSSTVLSASASEQVEEDSLYKYLSVFTEVLRLVRSVYVEETDLPTLMAGALDGATDALDPFSVYVPAPRVEDYRRAKALGRSHSGMVVLKERGVAYVVSVDEGSPAEAAGITGDSILSKIEGLSTRSMPLWQILGYLTAAPGTELELEVIRRGTPTDVTLELATYELPVVRVEQRPEVTILTIPEIAERTLPAIEQALREAPEGPLLLDLRGASDGDSEFAYRLAGRFAAGELGRLVRGEEALERFSSQEPPLFEGDLAVLVNRGSQGAAEILTTVLEQSVAATVIGEPTFGHAGRSELIRLGSGAFLDVTDAFYTGPDGEPIIEALEPELEAAESRFAVPGSEEGEEETDEVDEILERALELFLESAADEAGERAVA